MWGVAEFSGSRRVPQFAALALIAFAVAGCSADMTSRFQQSSIANPFGYQGEATGTVPAAAPAPQVEQRDLPQYSRPHSQVQSSALPPAVGAPQTTPVASQGVSGGGRGLASYAPPAKPKLETTGTVPPRSVASAHPQRTTIIVGTSDTLEVLAQRYHVTPAAILAANGYKGPRTLSPGQQLIIPNASTAAAPVAAAPATKPVASAAASVHVVNHGDTLAGIAHRNHLSVSELAKANNLDANTPLKQGTRLTVPAK